MPGFDRIISLGSSCTPAYQIRRHFGEKASFPFDWSLLRMPDVVPALKSKMQDEFSPEAVKRGSYIDRPAIFGKYATHLHDLPEPVMAAPDDAWRGQLGLLQRRFDFMWRLLEEAAQGEVLFIRSSAAEDEYLRPNFPEFFRDISNALKEVFSRASVTFLCVDYQLDTPLDIPGLITAQVESYQPHNMGCDRGWSELFERLGIRRREN